MNNYWMNVSVSAGKRGRTFLFVWDVNYRMAL